MAAAELLLALSLITMAGGVAMTSLARSVGTERGDVSKAKNVEALKSYFKCPACDPDRCPSLRDRPDCEAVRELGVCSCCLVCALGRDAPCGMFTDPCAAGLRCALRDPASDSVEALFYGEGLCLPATGAGEGAGGDRRRSNYGHFSIKRN